MYAETDQLKITRNHANGVGAGYNVVHKRTGLLLARDMPLECAETALDLLSEINLDTDDLGIIIKKLGIL